MHQGLDPYHRPAVLVLTGAGISADSGLATFRGLDGLWEGHAIEEVATPEAWRSDPALVWRVYQLRRAALKDVEPNAAHVALARLEGALARADIEYTLVTQNVDNLHDRAGSHPLHMHGELEALRCETCGKRVFDDSHLEPLEFVPCAACGAERLRPDIVWFGEHPRHMTAIETRLARASHVVVIGTSGVVYPAAGFLSAARAAGATTLVNSLEEPANLHALDTFVAGRAKDVVPALVDRLLDELT
jgi:NAD-dependent deacetylase